MEHDLVGREDRALKAAFVQISLAVLNVCRPVVSGARKCAALLLYGLLAYPAWSGEAPKHKPVEMNVMLCDTPEHAVAFVVAINQGDVDDEAKDKVGKAAGREVCDKFMGLASTGEEQTLLKEGITYKVTAYQFPGVGKMRWSAIPQN
ncbi:hypothetical protein CWB41_12350 [Methylovirgula ligni]|uniref:Uncharacterized protein n=1 Tax=Methylovirgula ligni TaxID=569860 RepID=A0A3D9YTA4_9HYPH|nr:hypothetical protein [Methylovirgula ligni]QAY96424.1 hypothetical protein CWB41_12350 [Methylovirgula ligni]REF85850.1 hypothetical protein DES32_1886 [Methylovirgula ligni]